MKNNPNNELYNTLSVLKTTLKTMDNIQKTHDAAIYDILNQLRIIEARINTLELNQQQTNRKIKLSNGGGW